jgi:hypothetical protein
VKISLAGGLSGLLLDRLTRLSPTHGAIPMALTGENRGIRGQYSLDAILDYYVPTRRKRCAPGARTESWHDGEGKGEQGGFMSEENHVCFCKPDLKFFRPNLKVSTYPAELYPGPPFQE